MTASKVPTRLRRREMIQGFGKGIVTRDVLVAVFQFLPLSDRAHAGAASKGWLSVFQGKEHWGNLRLNLNKDDCKTTKGRYARFVSELSLKVCASFMPECLRQ